MEFLECKLIGCKIIVEIFVLVVSYFDDVDILFEVIVVCVDGWFGDLFVGVVVVLL